MTIDIVDQGPEVLTQVSDTGPGLPPSSSIESLFDPYVRGTNARGKGLGLGLATSEGIVEAHRGRAWSAIHAGRLHVLVRAAAPAGRQPVRLARRARSRRRRCHIRDRDRGRRLAEQPQKRQGTLPPRGLPIPALLGKRLHDWIRSIDRQACRPRCVAAYPAGVASTGLMGGLIPR